MSVILNCGLNKEALTAIVGLLEEGYNPEAVAHVVKEIQRNS